MKSISSALVLVSAVLILGLQSIPATASSRSTNDKGGAKLKKKAPNKPTHSGATAPKTDKSPAQSSAVQPQTPVKAIPAPAAAAVPLVRKGLEAEIAPAIVYGQYGGDQGNRLFRKHSETIINQISGKIVADRAAGKEDSPDDLKNLLLSIGVQRSWLAGKTQTEDKADFGKWRAGSAAIIETSVDAVKYPLLDSMLRDSALAAVSRLAEVPWLNSTGWMEYPQSRIKAGVYRSYQDFQGEMAEFLMGVRTEGASPTEAKQVELEMEESRITSKVLNIHLGAACLDPKGMKENRKDFKGVEFGMLYLQVELKFGDLFYPVTGAYTCVPYRKGTIDLELFNKYLHRSFLFLVHTSGVHMDTLLENLRPLWQQTIHWDSAVSSQEDLKKKVGELHYRLSHIMPYFRGSAAGLEWLTSAVYRSYGLSPSLRNWNSVEQAILGTFDLERFLAEYVEQVHVAPLQP